jgi:hypothetical protein
MSKKKSKGVLRKIGDAVAAGAEVVVDAGSAAIHAVGDMMPGAKPKKAAPKKKAAAKKAPASKKAAAKTAKAKAAPKKKPAAKAAPKKKSTK